MIIKLVLLVLLLLVSLAFAAALLFRLQRTGERLAQLHREIAVNNEKLQREVLKMEQASVAYESAEAAKQAAVAAEALASTGTSPTDEALESEV
jgi:biopolymer transport protein ExbB/TolQ